MRIAMRKWNPLPRSLVLLGVFVGIMVCAPLLSAAHAPSTAITIVNNSSHEIRHVYLSPPDTNNWGPDQLLNSVIAPNGGSFTINANCAGSSIKVIAEDNEGCFMYQVVQCAENLTWTISANTARDCGSLN
jgi:hypothetical protein